MLAAISAISLGLGDYGVIGGMMAGVTGILLANVRLLGKRIDTIEARVGEMDKGKADKLDWARETMMARGKMARVGEQIAKLDGKLDANFGLGAVITRLTEELAKRRETPNGTK